MPLLEFVFILLPDWAMAHFQVM